MTQKRKLPLAFWLLLLAAIAVALVLVVGTVLENKKNSPEPTATPTPAPKGDTDQTKASTSSGDGKPATPSCNASELTLSGADNLASSRLVGWGAEPFQLTFWALDSKTSNLSKYTVASLQDSSASVTESSNQELVCKSHQEPGCLFLGEESANGATVGEESLADLWLQNDMGLAYISPKGKIEKSKPVLARIESGKLMFHETLGFCGQRLQASPDQLTALVDGSDEHRTLRVFEWASGGVFKYETLGANTYSRNETAVHPTYAQQTTADGLEDLNCRELLKEQERSKLFAIRDIQARGATLAFIASGRKTFDSDQEVWVLTTQDPHAALKLRLPSAKLGFTPGSLMFEPSSKLLVSSSNFFQTKATSKVIDLASGSISASDFAGAWPGEALTARENRNLKVPAPQNDLQFVYQDSKKVAGAVRVGQTTVNLPGTFAPEERPRLLLSNRGPNDWLLFYQGIRNEAPHFVRVVCR